MPRKSRRGGGLREKTRKRADGRGSNQRDTRSAEEIQLAVDAIAAQLDFSNPSNNVWKQILQYIPRSPEVFACLSMVSRELRTMVVDTWIPQFIRACRDENSDLTILLLIKEDLYQIPRHIQPSISGIFNLQSLLHSIKNLCHLFGNLQC